MSPRIRTVCITSAAAAGAVLLAIGIGLAGCSKEVEAPKPEPIQSSRYKAEEPFNPLATPGATPPKVAFADATAGSGLDFTHVNAAYGKKYLPETMGSGAVLFDYDDDRDLDVFFVQGMEWPDRRTIDPPPSCRLFRNDGGLKFADVTKEVGLDAITLFGMGACAADYDADGDLDLFVTALGPYRLLRHETTLDPETKAVTSRRFVDVAKESGLVTTTWKDKQGREHPSWSTGAAWLDYDADGVLDLFVCHYVHWSVENDVVEMLGSAKAYTKPTKYEADSCRLFRGRGDGTFEDVTKQAGIERNDAKALGCAIVDLNGDRRPDIAVSNDTQPNYLFVSQPDKTFRELADEAGMAYDANGRARAGMGIDAADLRDNGCQVISIGNFSGEPVSLYTQQKERTFFVDQAAAAHIAAPTNLSLTFGVLFCDYDLDGALDVLICNGHIEPEINTVTKEVTYEEPTQLFWNRGDGMFVDVSRDCGEALTRRLVGRGVAAGDLDRDGDLDLVITQNGRQALLFRNDQALGRGWLRTRLRGAGRNRDALGATVTLIDGERRVRRDVRTGSSYLSQCDVAPTFGLGPRNTGTAMVEVRWPSGKPEIEVFDELAVNAEHVLEQGKGKPPPKG